VRDGWEDRGTADGHARPRSATGSAGALVAVRGVGPAAQVAPANLFPCFHL
jgi:hypothetical protein